MIRNMTRFAPLFALAAMLIACGDDKDSAPKKRNLGFSVETVTFNEADGEVEIEVTLDKPALRDLSIDFSITGGTARDPEKAEDLDLFADYEIQNNDFEITIDEGETTGTIEIELFSDVLYEDTETIVLKIDDVDIEGVELTDAVEVTVNIEQEHGLFIGLGWDDDYDGDNNTSNDPDDDIHPDSVDMDLLMWAENEDGGYSLMADFFIENTPLLGREEFLYEGEIYLLNTNWVSSKFSPEYIFIPSVALEDGNYAVGCTYFYGPSKDLKFQLNFVEVQAGGEGTTLAEFNPTYTAANINDDLTLSTVKYVATFSKEGNTYSGFDFTTPESGSRVQYLTIPEGINKIYDRKLNSALQANHSRLKRVR
jgi:hypothetical protein